MTAIIMKELRTYFTQMTGYIFLALMVFLTALFFVAMNVFSLNPNFQQVLSTTTILFFILIPTLTMRLFADELKNKTDQLLYTSPLSVWQIVLGKYLAAAILFFFASAVTMLFPLIISRFGELPNSQIIGAYVGFILIGWAFIAVGLFVSVMTENQIIAAVGTAGALFLLFIMDSLAAGLPADANSSFIFIGIIIIAVAALLFNSTKNIIAAVLLGLFGFGAAGAMFFTNRLLFDAVMPRTFMWFSVFSRYADLTRGILNFADIVFYISFAIIFIYLTINVIEKRRWR